MKRYDQQNEIKQLAKHKFTKIKSPTKKHKENCSKSLMGAALFLSTHVVALFMQKIVAL